MAGRVTTVSELETFLAGRAETVGLVTAAFAAAACARAQRNDLSELISLEAEFDARTPSSEMRKVSRDLGRQLCRAMNSIHPHPHFDALGLAPHQPVVMGVAAAALGLEPTDAALAVLHETAAGVAAAATKVMRVDPFEIHAVLFRASDRLGRLAGIAAETADRPFSDLPAPGAPLTDIGAEHHRRTDVRLFAS